MFISRREIRMIFPPPNLLHRYFRLSIVIFHLLIALAEDYLRLLDNDPIIIACEIHLKMLPGALCIVPLNRRSLDNFCLIEQPFHLISLLSIRLHRSFYCLSIMFRTLRQYRLLWCTRRMISATLNNPLLQIHAIFLPRPCCQDRGCQPIKRRLACAKSF